MLRRLPLHKERRNCCDPRCPRPLRILEGVLGRRADRDLVFGVRGNGWVNAGRSSVENRVDELG